jgi:flagellin-like hook-associated protein FlgL
MRFVHEPARLAAHRPAERRQLGHLHGPDPASASSDTLISATAENSAIQSAIQSQQTQSTSLQQNLGTLISSDSSADVATTDTKLTEAQTSYQAVLEASARIMQTTLLNYLTTTTA